MSLRAKFHTRTHTHARTHTQTDPLTQAAQHKCGNPVLSTSNKAFTQNLAARLPPSTWNCRPNTYTTGPSRSQTILGPSASHKSPAPQDQASISFCLPFPPLTGLRRGSPGFFACVWCILLTYLEPQTSLSRLSLLASRSGRLCFLRDRCCLRRRL